MYLHEQSIVHGDLKAVGAMYLLQRDHALTTFLVDQYPDRRARIGVPCRLRFVPHQAADYYYHQPIFPTAEGYRKVDGS